MQKKDNGYVYYYENINFISKVISYSDYLSDQTFTEFVYDSFSTEDIKELKKRNDWNQPINEKKCVRKKIIDIIPNRANKLVPLSLRKEIYDSIPGCQYQDAEYYLKHLTSDEYDRHIYFFRTTDAELNYKDSYLVMFIQGKTYVVTEIFDVIDFQKELSEFKESNGWNLPLE